MHYVDQNEKLKRGFFYIYLAYTYRSTYYNISTLSAILILLKQPQKPNI